MLALKKPATKSAAPAAPAECVVRMNAKQATAPSRSSQLVARRPTMMAIGGKMDSARAASTLSIESWLKHASCPDLASACRCCGTPEYGSSAMGVSTANVPFQCIELDEVTEPRLMPPPASFSAVRAGGTRIVDWFTTSANSRGHDTRNPCRERARSSRKRTANAVQPVWW
jgi:hypothetical protein